MNREVLESQWLEIREILRDKFSNLTEEDIRQINGRYDQLVAKLQQKYGYSREEAEDRIRSWNFDRFGTHNRISPTAENRGYRDENIRTEDSMTPLKWLLALGIPLLLLAAYFLSPTATDRTTPTVASEQIAETPADRAISTNIRNALIAQNLGDANLQNVRINTQNGVVTLSGTVPNREVRNNVVSIAENTSGVRRVIDNLHLVR